VITLAGVKPEGIYQWGRSTFWLYGLAEPLTGESYFEQFDQLNSENFKQFIHQFAARYADDVVVIQMDQASAHRAQGIDWPENIIPLFQPADTPEVNPIERFWQHLKTPLQWEIFKNLKSLRQRVQEVLSQMTTEVIRSVTGWEFIADAVLIPILYEVALNKGLKPLVPLGFILCKLKLNWYKRGFTLNWYK
jgi:transposase